jgi:endonuclease IV
VPGKQKLLIETTAGTGNNMGDTLEELRDIRKGVKDGSRVGFICDTQHM